MSIQSEHQALHEKFRRYGANAKEWTRRCALLLPDVAKHRIWERKKFGSIYEYAAKLAGMSRDQVNEALRILQKIEDKPALWKVVEKKGIGAVKPVVTVATIETADFWAEKAMLMSKHTLETYVKELRLQGNLFLEVQGGRKSGDRNDGGSSNQENERQNGRPGTVENMEFSYEQANLFSEDAERAGDALPRKKIVAMDLEPEVAERLEKLKGQGTWNDLMEQLLQVRSEQLERQKPDAVKTTSRHIPRTVQRYIAVRTNGTCAFPGCKKAIAIWHHTQRFALEKVHDPDRLYGLCTEHERIAHLGLIANEESDAAGWRVQREPDRSMAKYRVDELVGRYRQKSVKVKR